jgi:hypothetical protein
MCQDADVGMTRTALALGSAMVVAAGGCSTSTPEPMVTVYVTATPSGSTQSPTTSTGPKAMVALPAVALTEVRPDELPEGFYAFVTPSKRIGCMIFSGQTDGSAVTAVRCDILVAKWAVPAPKLGCDGLGWGGGPQPDTNRSIGLEGKPGRPKVLCVSDSVMKPDAAALAYGTGVKIGTVTCESRSTGLRCLADEGGGFDLSRESLVMACPHGKERIVVRNAADPCAEAG